MSFIDIAAIIGAAAWIPQILRHFIKAKLKIIPASTIELGYSFLGPITNPTCAFSSSIKDALIEKMILEISHQDGETHDFLWQSLDEKGYEGRSSKGETVEMRRTQSATAIKIGTVALVDRKILFQDIVFKERRLTLEGQLVEKMYFLKKADEKSFPESVFKSEEYVSLNDLYISCFYWKEGKYTISIIVHEATHKKPFIERYSFFISKNDLSALERNIPFAQEHLRLSILLWAGKIPEIPILPWNWIYLPIEKVNHR